jgi:hypothetical protein
MEKAKSVATASTVKRPQPWTAAGTTGRTKKTRTEAGGSNAEQGKKRLRQSDHRDGRAGTEKKRICLKIRTDQAVENVLNGEKI